MTKARRTRPGPRQLQLLTDDHALLIELQEHPGWIRATMPTTRKRFWREKFKDNVERDARKLGEFVQQGWRTTTIRKCEISEAHLKRLMSHSILSSIATRHCPVAPSVGAPVYYAFPSAAISRKTISALNFAESAPRRAVLLLPLNELTVIKPYDSL